VSSCLSGRRWWPNANTPERLRPRWSSWHGRRSQPRSRGTLSRPRWRQEVKEPKTSAYFEGKAPSRWTAAEA
jgi:hypothetical protein